ncbi:tetratricopeptide repeat protein [Desulfosarcina ovata]|uniref:Sel1 repeat family protein n=1 Tax=Desulfosarcina ovata subsp. ovata TaxID=2752305 RepID=A0A5K8AK79_9BACT|nr:tetratricopeptide repeat protein [Desulfosarcina ovata]BBO93112.1 hypothetical protein DSCOOX_62920 [Desulfosarcina ovata subsp. ovata]
MTFRKIILISCLVLIQSDASCRAGNQPIVAAFGQTLGAVFDPAEATGMSSSDTLFAFDYPPPATLPVLSDFKVFVTPMTYRIYAIVAQDEIGDGDECRRWADTLFSGIARKYVGDAYAAEAYRLEDPPGYKIKHNRGSRWISVKCHSGGVLWVVYADTALTDLAKKEHAQWATIKEQAARKQYEAILPPLRRYADQGNLQALTMLGFMYRYGEGCAQDLAAAEANYQRAAVKGYVPAQFNLGTMCLVQHRYEESEVWLKKAAEQGFTAAQNNLAQLYIGQNNLHNPPEAFRWFLRAAEGGHIEAQYNTCHMYSAGDGVPRDEVMAYKWCHIAGTNGHRKAAQNRDFIAGQMKPEDITRARQMAERWMADNQSQPDD